MPPCSAVKRTRRSRSRDKTPEDKNTSSAKCTTAIFSTDNKEPTEDNWDLDIENEINFDEMETDETVESKTSGESKSEIGNIADKFIDTGETKVTTVSKDAVCE